jgi:hypothetical protein
LRPLEVRNVYNGAQIKIIVLQNELGIEQNNVPEFEEIFDEDKEEADADRKDGAEDKEEEDEDKGGDDKEKNNRNLYSDEDVNNTNSKTKNEPVKSKRKRLDSEILRKPPTIHFPNLKARMQRDICIRNNAVKFFNTDLCHLFKSREQNLTHL